MADGANVFNAIIQAVDHATAPIKAIVASLGHLGHAAEEAGHKTEHLEHARMFEALSGHVTLLRGHFGELNAGIGEVGHSITEFLPALAALGAAGSLVGLVEMVEHVSEVQASLAATAVRIGVTTRELATLNTVAQLTDVSVEKMQRGFLLFDKAVANAAAGKNKDVAALLHHLGISAKGAGGHLKSVTELLPELSEAFKRTADPAIKVRMAMALFGKSGAEMLPMLVGGREAMKEFAEQAEKVNFVPDKEGLEGLEETHRAFVLLTTAATAFETAIATKLAPILRPVLEEVTEWVVANRDWVASNIAAKVGELAAWIGKLHIHEAVESIKEFAASAMGAVQSVGGLNAVIGAAVLVLGSPILSAVSAAIEIFGTFKEVLVGIGEVLWANPILAAIGVVALGAYELYLHWDGFRNQFFGVWAHVRYTVTAAWDYMDGLFHKAPLLFAPLALAVAPFVVALGAIPLAAYEIWQHWEPLKAFFKKLWSDIVAIFDAAWGRIKPIVDALTDNFVVREFVLGSQQLANGGLRLAGAAVHAAEGAGSEVSGVFSGAAHAAGSAVSSANDLLKGALFGPRVEALPSPANSNIPELPNLYAPPDTTASDAPDSRVHVQVDLRGLPPGSQVQTTSQGLRRAPTTSVGYANPLAAGL